MVIKVWGDVIRDDGRMVLQVAGKAKFAVQKVRS